MIQNKAEGGTRECVAFFLEKLLKWMFHLSRFWSINFILIDEFIKRLLLSALIVSHLLHIFVTILWKSNLQYPTVSVLFVEAFACVILAGISLSVFSNCQISVGISQPIICLLQHHGEVFHHVAHRFVLYNKSNYSVSSCMNTYQHNCANIYGCFNFTLS